MCWDGFGLGLVKIQFKINSVLILKDGIGWARGRHSLRQLCVFYVFFNVRQGPLNKLEAP